MSGMNKRTRIRAVISAAALAAGMTVAAGAAAAGQSEAARAEAFSDHHGLAAGAGVIREWTLGTRVWHVWVCDLAGGGDGSAPPLPSEYARLYNQRLTPYFLWLSQGNYRPVFVGKRILNAPGSEDGPPRRERCQEQTVRDETVLDHPAIIVDTSGYGGGEAVPDVESGSRYGRRWPLRITGGTAWVGGASGLGVAAHEIGHVLSFPHSYSGDGTRTADDGSAVVDHYDNPMDVMSWNGGALRTGTPAVNRYAAGWIAPEEVAVHDGGYAEYALRPTGGGGTQMLVVPVSGGDGVFYALGARVRDGYDRGVPAEGVETYLVDQSGVVDEQDWVNCSAGGPIGEWCWGLGRRTRQFPGPGAAGGLSVRHVRPAYGEPFELGDWRLQVRQRAGDAFAVRVWHRDLSESDIHWGCAPAYNGSFCDDDVGAREAEIEALAQAGIADGCRPAFFCPERVVRRSQMAAFLFRAAQLADPAPPGGSPAALTDVAEGAWYRPYAEWAVARGAMAAPDGRFHPDGPVSRADAALMLAAVFDEVAVPEARLNFFYDMGDEPEETVRAAETLFRMGITSGCSAFPRRFCPSRPVTRGQMASLLARVLDLDRPGGAVSGTGG